MGALRSDILITLPFSARLTLYFSRKEFRMILFVVPRLRKISQPLTTCFALTISITLISVACTKARQDSSLRSVPPKSFSATKGSTSSGRNGEFEGIINVKLVGTIPPAQMSYAVKGDLKRLETSIKYLGKLASNITIMDIQSGTNTVLLPRDKAYTTISMYGGAQAKIPKVKHLGQPETIAGYTCEHWLYGDEQNIDLCAAKGIGYLDFGNEGQNGTPFLSHKNLRDPQVIAILENNPDLKKFVEGGMFPLKVSQIENGKPKPIMEVTSVEPKALDDSIFTIPADYRKIDAPSMPSVKRE